MGEPQTSTHLILLLHARAKGRGGANISPPGSAHPDMKVLSVSDKSIQKLEPKQEPLGQQQALESLYFKSHVICRPTSWMLQQPAK